MKEYPLPEDHRPVFDTVRGQRERVQEQLDGQIEMEI
jgi:hypothetical protein